MTLKTKTSAVLETLSDSDQERLLFWLETAPYRKVLQLVAAPAPEGFGLKVHLNSLCRFYARHQRHVEIYPEETASDLSQHLTRLPVYDRAAALSVRQAAMQLAATPQNNLKKFKTLSRWVLHLRDQEQVERSLALAEKRYELARMEFEFNAARAALNHAAEFEQILEDPAIDNQDKIDRARKRLFGKIPEENAAASGAGVLPANAKGVSPKARVQEEL